MKMTAPSHSLRERGEEGGGRSWGQGPLASNVTRTLDSSHVRCRINSLKARPDKDVGVELGVGGREECQDMGMGKGERKGEGE